MNLLIQEDQKADRLEKVDKLVTTVGLGPSCDITLGESEKSLRIGMIIKQEEHYNFKPLLLEGEVTYEDSPLYEMRPFLLGEKVKFSTFTISLAHDHHIPNLSQPKINFQNESNKTKAIPTPTRRYGAIQAYQSNAGQTPPPQRQTKNIPIPATQGTNKPQNKDTSQDMQVEQFFEIFEQNWFSSEQETQEQLLQNWLEEIIPTSTNKNAIDLRHTFIQKLKKSNPIKKYLEDKDLIELKISSLQLYTNHDCQTYQSVFNFVNQKHLYWHLYHLFQDHNIKISFKQPHRSLRLKQWGVQWLLPPLNQNGPYIQFNRNFTLTFAQMIESEAFAPEPLRLFKSLLDQRANFLITGTKTATISFLTAMASEKRFSNRSIFLLQNQPNFQLPKESSIPVLDFDESKDLFYKIEQLSPSYSLSQIQQLSFINRLLPHLYLNPCGWMQTFTAPNSGTALQRLQHLIETYTSSNDKVVESIVGAFQYHLHISDPHFKDNSSIELKKISVDSNRRLKKQTLKETSTTEKKSQSFLFLPEQEA